MSDQDTATDGAPSFPAFDNEMAEILESFIVETREIYEKLGPDLILLDKGSTDPELMNGIFRAVHTVKGTSSFLGLDQLTGLAHVFEDVLNKMRKGELTVTPDKMDVMFDAFDIMKILLEKIETHDAEPADLSAIVPRLKAIAQANGAPPPEPDEPFAADPAIEILHEEHDLSGEDAPLKITAESPQAAAAPTGAPSDVRPAAKPKTGGEPTAKAADTTIRVDVSRLDSLMNLVGELVLGRNRLTQIAFQVNEEYEGLPISKELSETSSQIDFITTELQMAVMKTRMVPIAKVFNKLPRLIRDLSKETGKEIELILSGEETELDKSIIEELNDPLVHMLRNSADHGIEPPDQRKTSGKPPVGKVIVKAEHEGNHIVISIEDDGRGMDAEKLKAKAIEKGLITEAQAREMSKRDAFNLIFAPGFSTAAKVTNVSGRGVGMDVVRTNITKLKGIVEIESEVGVGSKMIIKLPLTLAIIQALLVQVANEIFSIPLGSVLEVVRIQAKDIGSINGREVVRLRNSVLPLARITDVMGVKGNGHGSEWIYIVVVGLAEQRLGVIVDSMLGQKEVVIKTLGDYLGTVPGIAGSTILGDGRVIMIVDVGELMKLCAQLGR